MDKKRLFVDMDGTLAVFTPVDTLETLYQPGYFLNQAPHINVIEAVRQIISDCPDIEVNILSAYLSDSNYALAEKNEWLDRYLPEISSEHRVFLPCGEDKKSVIKGGVKSTDYLLDDYTKNLTLWHPPGSGIKLLNGINHTHKTWQRDCVGFDNSPDMLAAKLFGVMRGVQAKDSKPQEQMNRSSIAERLDSNKTLIANEKTPNSDDISERYR